MTSILFESSAVTTTTTTARSATAAAAITKTTTTTAADATDNIMVWPNEKISLACVDNMGLMGRQLWKLLATKTNSNKNNNENGDKNNGKQQCNNNNINNNYNCNEKINKENCENLVDFLTNRNILRSSRMSLLNFLAINALNLSAPATPSLLQQNKTNSTALNSTTIDQPKGWMQLSGHPESIVPTTSGIVRKRISDASSDSELRAYQLLSGETEAAAQIVPQFFGTRELNNGEHFIELQDLLAGFVDPCVMDIKMGCRTFLESEVSNKNLRSDLYQKMLAVDPNAPTAEEHRTQAVTKLRYMLFREALSSSHTKGYRIEALRMRGCSPQKDLKTIRSSEQIEQTIAQFVSIRHDVVKHLLQRLRSMRSIIERSSFFATHEIVGASVFIVYDEARVGAWLIDFAKARPLPAGFCVTHRNDWLPGNHEEGLLRGFDELITSFEYVQQKQSSGAAANLRKCLHF